jgi:hypothetical protein
MNLGQVLGLATVFAQLPLALSCGGGRDTLKCAYGSAVDVCVDMLGTASGCTDSGGEVVPVCPSGALQTCEINDSGTRGTVLIYRADQAGGASWCGYTQQGRFCATCADAGTQPTTSPIEDAGSPGPSDTSPPPVVHPPRTDTLPPRDSGVILSPDCNPFIDGCSATPLAQAIDGA